MKIIVVSDSHGKQGILEQIVEKHPDADAYLHCGDIEDYAENYPSYIVVQGNIDIYYDYPDERVITAGSHRIYMTHGHHFSYIKRLEQMADTAKAKDCDIVCYGHTHVAADDVVHGIRLINPGSLWRSRDGRGPSYAILTLQEEQVDVEFIFLPQKKSKFFW